LIAIREKLMGLEKAIEQMSETGWKEKTFHSMLAVLQEMYSQIENLEKTQKELTEYIRTVDDDLNQVENYVYGDVKQNQESLLLEDEMKVVQCQNCGENIYLEDKNWEESEVVCPSCQEIVALDDEFYHDDEYNESNTEYKGKW